MSEFLETLKLTKTQWQIQGNIRNLWQLTSFPAEAQIIPLSVQARGGSWPRTAGQITNWRVGVLGGLPASAAWLWSLFLVRGGWACAQPANPEDSQVHKGTKEMGQGCFSQGEAQENPCPKAVPPGPWKVIWSWALVLNLYLPRGERRILTWAKEIHSVIDRYLQKWTGIQETLGVWGKEMAWKRGPQLTPRKVSEAAAWTWSQPAWSPYCDFSVSSCTTGIGAHSQPLTNC